MLKLEARPQPSGLMSWASPLLALAITVLIGIGLFVLLGKDPVRGLQLFFVEPVKTLRALAELSVKAVPLLLIALGLAVCFRSNVWNIGAEGQYLVGAIAGTGVGTTDGLTTFSYTGNEVTIQPPIGPPRKERRSAFGWLQSATDPNGTSCRLHQASSASPSNFSRDCQFSPSGTTGGRLNGGRVCSSSILRKSRYVICSMTSNGLEMPPDQKAFQIWSIWLLMAPVIMSSKLRPRFGADQAPDVISRLLRQAAPLDSAWQRRYNAAPDIERYALDLVLPALDECDRPIILVELVDLHTSPSRARKTRKPSRQTTTP